MCSGDQNELKMGVVEVTEYYIELVGQKENMTGGVILVPMKAFNSNCICSDGRSICFS